MLAKVKQLLSAIHRRKSGHSISPLSYLAGTSDECLLCRGRIQGSLQLPMLCSACAQRIPWIREVKCPVCGRGEPCGDCARRQETYFRSSRSAIRYNAEAKEWLARYKYRGEERLAELFGVMLCYPYEALRKSGAFPQGKPDAITYIPLSGARLEERGFNQAEQLAQFLGSRYKIPVFSLLRRTLHTDKQSFKKRADRLKDMESAFETDPEGWDQLRRLLILPGEHRPLTILLIDDVYTTGSTLNQCSKIIVGLKEENSVIGLIWAR